MKSRYRSSVSKKYGQVNQRVVGMTNYCIEAKLRILRSYRLKILHEFCHDVLKEAYSDSISIQTLLACRELRRRSQLFPSDPQLFTVRFAENFQEHLPKALYDAIEATSRQKNPEEPASLEKILRGKAKTLFYIPSSSEIMACIKQQGAADTQLNIQSGRLAKPVEQFDVDLDVNAIDELTKEQAKQATLYTATET